MGVLIYVAVLLLFSSAVCSKDIDFKNQTKINLVQSFSSNFLKILQWSNIIILTDDQDYVYLSKHLSVHLISARVAHVNEFELIELKNFSSVLIISKFNTAIEMVEGGLKLSHCPPNWLLIMEENKLENFGKFYIPHDIALFLLDFEYSHELWFIRRLYSADGNVITPQDSTGFWNSKNNALNFSLSSVPLPSFSDIPFRLTTVKFDPFFSFNESNGIISITGLHGKILKIIQSVFFFNATVTFPEDKLFGSYVNESFVSGMVGRLYRNESDIALSITKSDDRIKLINYSPDITRLYIKLVYFHKSDTQKRFLFYLEPFSKYSWICIMGFTALIAALLSIISCIKNKVQRWPKKDITYIQIIYYYTRSAVHLLLMTGIPVRVYGLSGRICLFVFHIFCIVMFINYCSSLTSILAVTRLKLPFNSFHEFIYGSGYDLATLKGTSIVQILKSSLWFLILQQSKYDLYSKSYQKLSSNPEKFLVVSNLEGKDLVTNQKIAYLMVELNMAALIKNNCSYRFLEETIIETDFCFTFNKQFKYQKLFNRYIQIILENGVNQKLYIDCKSEDHNDYCDRIKTAIAAIKMPAVAGLFFTLCLGIGVALVVFVVEILLKILFCNQI
uniref:Ionotropic glutamate receptor C-terminal domain-containing protein n=1 Tax=Strigamia maritima TaxID=126957 RepID=T1JP44_STRMM